MDTSTFNPIALDEAAHKASNIDSTATKATFLLDALGPRVMAAALGLSDARPLYGWREGIEPKTDDHRERLRILYRVGHEISAAYGPRVLGGFLRSSNPQLGDRAPLVVLAKGKPTEELENELLGATRAFLEG